jgi:hypothetical protein
MAYRVENYNNKVPILEFPIRLELGGGKFPQDGYINCDFDPEFAPIVWDLTNGIPLPDNSVSELYTSHFLEHLERIDYHYLLLEILRVCQNEAMVTIKVPYNETPEGRLPCHYGFFTENDMRAIDKWIHRESQRFTLIDMNINEYTLSATFKVTKQ